MGHAPPIHAHALTRRGGVGRVAAYTCDTPTGRQEDTSKNPLTYTPKSIANGQGSKNNTTSPSSGPQKGGGAELRGRHTNTAGEEEERGERRGEGVATDNLPTEPTYPSSNELRVPFFRLLGYL